jgi:protein O-GlcNAc transferase
MAPSPIQDHFNLALRQHRSGNLQQAEALYRQILAQHPEQPETLHLLGVLAQQTGRGALAVDLIGQAVRLRPNFPEALSNLAAALREQGRLDDAIAACRHAVALAPALAQAHCNLGHALWDKGLHDEAIAAFEQALALQPDLVEAHANLSNALRELGRLDEAITACRRALALQPHNAGLHRNLGLALAGKKQFDPAIAAYRQAIALQPGFAEAHNSLGLAFFDQGQLDEAIACFRQAIALNPGFVRARFNLGRALRDRGQLDGAIEEFRAAVDRDPRFSLGNFHLASALGDRGRLDEAAAALRHVIHFDNDPRAYCNLGNILKSQGVIDQAIAAQRQAIALNPALPEAHSCLLLSMLYNPGSTPAAIAEEHHRWYRAHAVEFASRVEPHKNDPSPERPLRIGYVSPDFREHVVARNILPFFKNRDIRQFSAVCYADVIPDRFTEEFRRLSDVLRVTPTRDHDDLARQIREDRIDILVDLALHSAAGRPLLFARKPAPVQVTFGGYPGTTGLATVDFRLSDPYLDPPEIADQDTGYSEKTLHLPSFWCYDVEYDNPPPVSGLPALFNGFITFGCLNNFCKINPGILDVWARVLNHVPESRLVLLADDGTHRQRTIRYLEQRGIAHPRIVFLEKCARPQYLRYFHQIDLSLDTLPYNGHTTSLDSLFMGVPVISLVGATVVGRAGRSQLTNLGLSQFVASSTDQFLATAREWSFDLPRLAALRAALRSRMQQSILMDAAAFARAIECAFRQMWRTWCAQRHA